MLAQREYREGVLLEKSDLAGAKRHFERALELDPNAQDVRSHYSDWLIERGQAAKGLDELKIVRQRLNSYELWEREARGLRALGRQDEARRAMETYYKRVWRIRQMAGGNP